VGIEVAQHVVAAAPTLLSRWGRCGSSRAVGRELTPTRQRRGEVKRVDATRSKVVMGKLIDVAFRVARERRAKHLLQQPTSGAVTERAGGGSQTGDTKLADYGLSGVAEHHVSDLVAQNRGELLERLQRGDQLCSQIDETIWPGERVCYWKREHVDEYGPLEVDGEAFGDDIGRPLQDGVLREESASTGGSVECPPKQPLRRA